VSCSWVEPFAFCVGYAKPLSREKKGLGGRRGARSRWEEGSPRRDILKGVGLVGILVTLWPAVDA